MRLVAALLAVVFLAGCGGGSGAPADASGPPSVTASPTATATTGEIVRAAFRRVTVSGAAQPAQHADQLDLFAVAAQAGAAGSNIDGIILAARGLAIDWRRIAPLPTGAFQEVGDPAPTRFSEITRLNMMGRERDLAAAVQALP